MTGPARVSRSPWRDALGLVLITLCTATPYVPDLGFYSDDWHKLAVFHSDALQHRFGLSSALRGHEDRPLQGLYLAALYKLFGFHALGYHLVNTAVIAAAVASFHWLLVRMGVDRARALAAAIILIILPQLSTVRVCYSTFQIPLSMLAALGSLHWQLSFARSGSVVWAVAAAVAALASAALYEIFAPAIAGFALGLVVVYRTGGSDARWLSSRVAPLVAVVAVIGAAMLAKIAFSDRAADPDVERYVKGLNPAGPPRL